MKLVNVIFILFISVKIIPNGDFSSGDESFKFQNCVLKYYRKSCIPQKLTLFEAQRPWYLRFFGWDCKSECEYKCMHNIKKRLEIKRQHIPQFYGKWPFKRIYGVQEPASFIFSIMNFLSNAIMLRKFLKQTPPSAPFYYIWTVYGILSLITWICSCVFHSRDNRITECMDYFSVLFLNCYFLFTFLLRAFGFYPKYRPFIFAISLLSLYIYHIYYMLYIKFDYAYNMKVNVVLGLCETFGWLIWGMHTWSKHNYVWRCILAVIIAKAILPLELGDFPPMWDIFDAHSIWHLFSIPLPILWFKFVMDDCTALNNERNLKIKKQI